jgi:protein TonB
MQRLTEQNRDRLRSAAGVAFFHALMGYGLLVGLGFSVPASVADELRVFDVFEEPPPPAVPPPPERVDKSRLEKPKDPEGAAAPPNLRDTPTQIVAPPPEIRLPIPPLIPAAPVAGLGNAEDAGAAEIPGPGTGRGGQGTGLGSGRFGTGTGGGGGGRGRGARARWLSGEIGASDYPDRALRTRAAGTVFLRFVVAPSGRVSQCAVTRSSGSPDLDATTCNLIRRRFRYRPARDGAGRPVAETVTGQHDWELAPEKPITWVEPEVVEED